MYGGGERVMDTGWRVPTVLISNTWISNNISTINVSDNGYALVGSTTEKTFETGNYNFMIPNGATIDGIELQAEISASSVLSTFSLRYSLSWNSGSSYTSTKTNSVTGTTDSTKTYGGSSDDWGHTSWAWNELADGTFRIKAAASDAGAGGPYLRLDYMAVKIYFTRTFNSDFMPFYRIRK